MTAGLAGARSCGRCTRPRGCPLAWCQRSWRSRRGQARMAGERSRPWRRSLRSPARLNAPCVRILPPCASSACCSREMRLWSSRSVPTGGRTSTTSRCHGVRHTAPRWTVTGCTTASNGVHHSVVTGCATAHPKKPLRDPEHLPRRVRPPTCAPNSPRSAPTRETDWIIDWAKANARHDPGAYLAKIIGNGGGPGLLDRARAELDGQAAPRPPKPPWCRQCDERTRLIELPDGRMAHCPRCHPLAARGEP